MASRTKSRTTKKRNVTASPKKPAKPSYLVAAKKFDQSLALVVLRDGSAIDQSQVLEKVFQISTDSLGVLTIPLDQIDTIILKNLPNFPLDVIRMSGNEISGTVLTDPVHIDSPQVGGKLTIALSKVLSIMF